MVAINVPSPAIKGRGTISAGYLKISSQAPLTHWVTDKTAEKAHGRDEKVCFAQKCRRLLSSSSENK